jgi:hypothetical protein
VDKPDELNLNGKLNMNCDHSNYDDYFGKCTDCGMEGEDIHKELYPRHFLMAVDDSGSFECQDCDYES